MSPSSKLPSNAATAPPSPVEIDLDAAIAAGGSETGTVPAATSAAPTLAPDAPRDGGFDRGFDQDLESEPDQDAPEEPIGAGVRIVNLIGVVVPFAGLITAFVLLWGVAFDFVHLAILAGMYLATAVGITVGYHRYFTHRSFNTSRPVAAILAMLGSMAVEGPVIRWVATHRSHHQHSDGEHDPHSPHAYGLGIRAAIRGMWHAHMGWFIFDDVPGLDKYDQDLRRDPLVVKMNRLFPLWVFLGLAIPAALGGLLTMSWLGVLLGFLWGGLVRIFLVHHVTWSINSVCHIWGRRPFRSHDESRNNAIFGVLALGEGWHNNHHAFPTSARHGLGWWQIDVSYLIIKAMGLVGLATDIRVPSAERIAAKRRG